MYLSAAPMNGIEQLFPRYQFISATTNKGKPRGGGQSAFDSTYQKFDASCLDIISGFPSTSDYQCVSVNLISISICIPPKRLVFIGTKVSKKKKSCLQQKVNNESLGANEQHVKSAKGLQE